MEIITRKIAIISLLTLYLNYNEEKNIFLLQTCLKQDDLINLLILKINCNKISTKKGKYNIIEPINKTVVNIIIELK